MSKANLGVQWCRFIVRVSGPGARQNGGCFWQWYAPPAFYRPILAPYYTRDPSWLFGAAPGGKIWATWPHHHRMPAPILEAKGTSAAWTTTMAIQLARLPEFAPTSIYYPSGVPHNSHTEIRTITPLGSSALAAYLRYIRELAILCYQKVQNSEVIV